MKTITLKVDGKAYTLEYNRAIVVLMERNGFSLSEFDTKNLLNTTLLVKFAFFLHHRKLAEEEILEIFDKLPKKEDFVSKLLDMVSDTYLTMSAEPDETDEGNASWEASF